MASDIVYGAVQEFLTGRWNATKISWENQTYSLGTETAWIMVEITGTSYAQQSIGAGDGDANRWDEDGVLFVHVFVESGLGSLEARRLAKLAADLFRGTLLLGDTLEFGDASIGMGDVSEANGNWWRVSVSIEWRRIEA